MTCVEAARIFEAQVEKRLRKARSEDAKIATRYHQMNRLAHRLRQHGGEHRFTDDVRPRLADLHELELFMLEVVMNDWWGWPQ